MKIRLYRVSKALLTKELVVGKLMSPHQQDANKVTNKVKTTDRLIDRK